MTRPTDPVRSMLFVPGDRPDRIAKAAASGADAIAIDLEDAVANDRKAEARLMAVEAIARLDPARPLVAVRINAVDSGEFEADLDGLAGSLDDIDFLVLAMASSADQVRSLAEALDSGESASAPKPTGIIPLIETAAGVQCVGAIASAHPRVRTLTFGPADLSRQLGITPTAGGEEMATARSLVVLAAAAAGLSRPIDGPFLTLDDEVGLSRSVAAARALGFGGKQLIHPAQLAAVQEAFRPTAAEREWARSVDIAFAEAESRGVSSVRLADGTFVDYPIARRARSLLEDA